MAVTGMIDVKPKDVKKSVSKPRVVNIDSYNPVAQQLLTFCVPFIFQSMKEKVRPETAMRIPERLHSFRCAPPIEVAWDREIRRAEELSAKGRKVRPSYLRAFMLTQWHLSVLGVVYSLLNGSLNAFIRPYLLRACINWLGDPDADFLIGGLLWGGLIVVSLLEGWTATATMRICFDEAFATFAAASTQLMCKKSFTVSRGDAQLTLSSLMGNDVVRTYETARGLGFLPISVTAIVGGIVMLLITVGPASLAGIAVMIVILVFNKRIAGKIGLQMKLNLEASGRRLAVLDQIVDSSKAVKFFSWEEPYLDLLAVKRAEEVKVAERYRWLLAISVQLGRASPIIASAVTIVCMTLAGEELNTADIFSTIAVFLALRLALIVLPQGWSSVKQLVVAFGRIQRFLEMPDEPPRSCLSEGCCNSVEIESMSLAWPMLPLVADSNSEGKAPSPPAEVVGGSLLVPLGRAAAIVGAVGAGKSTLLASIVGELQPFAGSVRASEKLAYAPQQPQVICGTVRENILLDRPEDTAKLNAAIKAAQLTHDLAILPGGLEAEIGERGVSLSGGQKQRVSLARTFYGLTDDALLVLDDPIAAVDPLVGRRILEEGVLAHRQRGGSLVVVLNQEEFLHLFDVVISLEDGRITERPPPARLASEDAREDAAHDTSASFKAASAMRTTEILDHQSLTIEEYKQEGTMGFAIVCTFIQAMGLSIFIPFLLVTWLGYTFMASADLWLVRWMDQGDLNDEENYMNLGVYLVQVLMFTICVLIASRLGVAGSTRASRSLHEETMGRLMKAPLSWWDGTPKGRITSRFSTDIGLVDTMLGFYVDNLTQLSSNLLALMVIVVVVCPIMLPLFLVTFVAFAIVMRPLDNANCEVKRMAHQGLSPLLSNSAECMQMRRVARLLGCQHIFLRRNEANIDYWNQMNFNSMQLMHFCKLLATFTATMLAAVATSWLMFISPVDIGLAAVSMTYAITIPYFLGMAAQVVVMVKAMFTSLERILEYRDLPQEPAWHQPGDPDGAAWPSQGAVEFQKVALRYRQGLALALEDVSFAIPGGARTGVIGRTGSGKSTLVACLFRLHEIESGQVLIDGVNIHKVGIRALRNHVTVVPQDPVLMQGSVRHNIDPFGKADAGAVRHAARRAELAATDDEVDAMLDRDLDGGGSNLSCGERQLICLARAVLSGPRILVLDEPTSSADQSTDEKLQSMLRTEFKCTTLCIAHRIRTVADSDLMLVMGDGRVVEFGSPKELYGKVGGEFRSMCDIVGVVPEGVVPDGVSTEEGPISEDRVSI